MFRHILVANHGAIARNSLDQLIGTVAEAAGEITCYFIIPGIAIEGSAADASPKIPAAATKPPLDRQQVGEWIKVITKAAAAQRVRCTSYCVTSNDPEKAIFAAAERYGCDAIAIAGAGENGLTLVNLQV